MNSIMHTHVHIASNDIIQFQIHLILDKKATWACMLKNKMNIHMGAPVEHI